jgi:RNA polymerase sigma factor (sigma-70 family)
LVSKSILSLTIARANGEFPEPDSVSAPANGSECSRRVGTAAARDDGTDDDRRLGDLYRRHWAELYGYVRRNFGPGPPDPEDVAQSAFAQFATRPDWRELEHPRAFIFRVAHNLVVDYHRADAVRSRFANERGAESEASDDLSAERVLSAKEQLSVIESALSTMEPRRRAVFVMNRIHELSFAEISRQLRIPETTVKRHVAEALVECMRALRERGYKDERPWQ